MLVEEAHRQGYRTAAHAEGLAGTELAIEQGIDTIEHGMYLNQRPDLLERMAASGQVLVPTLSCFYGVAGLGDVVGLDDGQPEQAGDGDAARAMPGSGSTRSGDAAPAVFRSGSTPLVAAARGAGATQSPPGRPDPARRQGNRGADRSRPRLAPVLGPRSGDQADMIAHGLTASGALSAATAGAAYALGIDAHVGTIEPASSPTWWSSTATRSPIRRCYRRGIASGWCCRGAGRWRGPRWSARSLLTTELRTPPPLPSRQVGSLAPVGYVASTTSIDTRSGNGKSGRHFEVVGNDAATLSKFDGRTFDWQLEDAMEGSYHMAKTGRRGGIAGGIGASPEGGDATYRHPGRPPGGRAGEDQVARRQHRNRAHGRARGTDDRALRRS